MFDFLNEIDPDKKEAIRVNFLINWAIVPPLDDKPWNEIIQEVNRIERLRDYSDFAADFPDDPDLSELLNISIESPFIQGDSKGANTGLPDIIFEGSDFVMGIEHFEFDSSRTNRKGSTMRQRDLYTKAELDNLAQTSTESVKGGTAVPIEINVLTPVELSFQSYLNSLMSSFRHHARRIEVYRRALTEKYPTKKVLLSFFIEDVTKVGNYIISEQKLIPLNPLRVKSFISELRQTVGIDYIAACFQEFYVHHLDVQQICDSNLKFLLEQCYPDDVVFWQYQYETTAHVYGSQTNSSAFMLTRTKIRGD